MTNFLLPLVASFGLGVASVLQSGMNRRITQSLSLPGAVWLNSMVLLSSATVLFLLSFTLFRSSGDTGGLSAFFSNLTQHFKFWYLVPGLCGLAIVNGIPWAISRWGALSTFVVMVGAQLLGGLTWDIVVESIPFSWTRLAGALIAISGAAIALLKG